MGFTCKFPFFHLSAAPDCFTCAFKVILNGSILFTASCYHDGKGVNPKLEVKSLNCVIFVLVFLPVLIAWSENFWNWNKTNQTENNFIQDLFNFLTQTWTLILVISMLKNYKLYRKYFNGINHIFLSHSKYHMGVVLSYRQIRRIQAGSMFIILVCYVVALSELISRLLNYDFRFSNVIKAFTSFVNIMSGSHTMVHTFYCMDVYEKVFRNTFNRLQQAFKLRLENKDGRKIFSTKITLGLSYYLSCVSNYQNHIFAFTTLFFDTWMFVYLIISQIFFFLYVSFITVHRDVEVQSGATASVLQSFYVVSICFYMIKRATDLNSVGQHFISTLYRLPLSNLSLEELQLVETLIHALESYKPATSAGNIFEIQKTIIPSVLGYVITFTLVAIQFNIFRYFY